MAAAAAIALVVTSQSALAQASSGADGLGIVVYTRELTTQAGQQPAATLLQKARDRGRVRVIVGLAVTLRDEDELSASQQAAQVQRLVGVQDGVAHRSLIPAGRVTKFETVPYMSAFVTPAQLQRLLNDGQVISIQEDVPVKLHLGDSVPLIRAKRLWQQGFTGQGRHVAVLDTGAEYSHPMFQGKVVAGFCRSTTSATTTSTCPGEAASSNTKASGRNCTGHSTCDHGTHVSGIAIGKTGALKGVARDAKLISGKVFSLVDSGGTTAFWTDINGGLERVFQLRNQFAIDSINMSVGTEEVFNTACDNLLPATAEIIDKLYRNRIATVISSGNGFSNSGISAPGCIDKAIAVGSTNKNDAISNFSNHHALVDVMAPGRSINSAVLGGGFGLKSGTSMAAPHVAGAIALLKEAHPTARVNQILRSLKEGVNLTRNGVVKPRIQLLKALNKLDSLVP
ncbi:MAG: S8 family serine peptidase [Rhizobiales bacterium]|nr:S8 family serine peptidase [Hyphomicrobiales bacterium]